MLYSIIPPILIVFSLIGIILLLMKKSDEIQDLLREKAEDEFGADEEKSGGFFGKINRKIIKKDNIKHFFLTVFEKATHKARLLFLKLESRSANLSSSIRERRKTRSQETDNDVSLQQESDIMKKLEEYDSGTKKELISLKTKGVAVAEKKIFTRREKIRQALFTKNNNFKETTAGQVDLEEREIKPIISDRVVTPKARTEIRDRLEELLIERIAVNPKDIEAYERLGEYYLEIKSLKDSKECFKQVLKLDPKNKNAKYRMRRLENLLSK